MTEQIDGVFAELREAQDAYRRENFKITSTVNLAAESVNKLWLRSSTYLTKLRLIPKWIEVEE